MGVVVLIVLVALPSFAEPPGRDQGIYLYNGREMLAGKVPHRDIFDQRPVGTVAVYALGMMLFGESMQAVRLIDLLWCLLSTGVIYLIGRRIFGRTAGFWGALLFGISYELLFNWWDSAACDGLMILPLSLAVCFAIQAEDQERGILYLWAGVFCGAAFWFKPSAAWIALGLGLAAIIRSSWRDALTRGVWICTGFLLTNAGILGAFWLSDGLIDVISQVYIFNWMVYIRPRLDWEFVRSWAYWTGRFLVKVHLPMLLAGLATIWGMRCRPDRRLVILLAWLGGSFVMAWTQWKLFGYHWTPIVAPLAVLAGQGVALLWKWLGPGGEQRRLQAWRVAAVAILSLSAGVYVWRYLPEFELYWQYRLGVISDEEYVTQFVRTDYDYGALRRIAAIVAEETRPDDAVLMWGVEPVVLFLADRETPSRFSFTFPVVASDGRPRFQSWRDEFLADVQARLPKIIILGEDDTNPLQPVSSVEQVAHWPAMQQFVNDEYEWGSTVAGYRLYRHKP